MRAPALLPQILRISLAALLLGCGGAPAEQDTPDDPVRAEDACKANPAACPPGKKGMEGEKDPPGCRASSECAAGMECDIPSGECRPPARCSMASPQGACAAGEKCVDGVCVKLPCSDLGMEPNESRDRATLVGAGNTSGLEICKDDVDWYRMDVPPGHIATLGAIFDKAAGDLDLSAYHQAGGCLGGRYPGGACTWSYRGFETGEEFLSVYNGRVAGNMSSFFQLLGHRGATNRYELRRELIEWKDGASCAATAYQDCQGKLDGKLRLIHFPFADPSDPYVGDGYRFDTVSNYRWLRRELVMLVRHAIRETQRRFPGTKPLGLIDMCQRDGITPGYDVNAPRHPQSTHDQGGNIDIAYYTTLASQGSLPYNEARIICDKDEKSNDGYYCSAGASRTHVVDLPRQVYFMAQLYQSPRLRVIGVDRVIGPLLEQEAERQYGLGWISKAARDLFIGNGLAYGSGWPFHHHHIHVSLLWWPRGSLLPEKEPADGCGFDLTRHRRRGGG